MLQNISWTSLQKESVIDLREIIKIGREIDNSIGALMEGEIEPELIYDIRSKLDILIRLLHSILYDEDVVKQTTDEWLHYKLFQENYGRLFKIVDEIEGNLSGLKIINKVNKGAWMPYLSQLQSMLYGDIYYPLMMASQYEKKDKRRFLYQFYKIIKLNAGLFGAESRIRSKTKGFDAFRTERPDELLSEEGQKKLEEEAKEFEGLEALKKVSKMARA